jgi:hypothetical protein
MTDPDPDDSTDPTAPIEPSAGGENAPTVSCTRCDREWRLEFELEELQAGNRALEQFALDHHRHTGHYPDNVTPWLATCRQCPAAEAFLAERPARRWAQTHARHTRHTVALGHEDEDGNGSQPSADEELIGGENEHGRSNDSAGN